MYYSVTLGRELRELREKLGLTLSDVAVRLGVSVQYVCDVESGRKSFPPAKLKAWAEVLRIMPDLIVAQLLAQEVTRLERQSEYKITYRVVPVEGAFA